MLHCGNVIPFGRAFDYAAQTRFGPAHRVPRRHALGVEYRQPDDSVLHAGEAITVGSDRDVVLSGLPDAQVALIQVAGAP